MNLRRWGIIHLFTKFGKEDFDIWFSGVEGEGEYKRWHDDGKIGGHSFYKDGKLHGEYKTWWPNGQMLEHAFCKNGKRDGEYKSWRDNGEISEHSIYKDGKVVKKIV